MAAGASAQAEIHAARLLSIGQVLERLQSDFTDLTPSKLRFLEEQGLVTPERTASGYRKFSQAHLERLRLILTLQRDHYLPLKVIAQILSEIDDGRDPVIPGAGARSVSSILTPRRVLTRDELLRVTGASAKFVNDAVSAGMLPATDVFPHEAVAELTALLQLAQQGISVRHLRAMRVAAEREAELVLQAVEARGARSTSLHATEFGLEVAEQLDIVRGGVLRRRLSRG